MREKIIEILDKDATIKSSIETLKTLLGIESSEDFKLLFKTLNELVDQAFIIESKSHEYSLIKNTNFIVGQLDLKERGFGFVIDRDKNIDDVFIRRDDINGAMNLDLVLVYISKYRRGARAEGEIRKVIERRYSHIIGTLGYRNGMGILFSDDKTIKQEIIIKKGNYNGAYKNDKVKAKIINYNFKGKIECEVSEVIGNMNDAGVDILSKILKYNIDPIFSDIVLEEANKYQSVSKADLEGRTDLRDEMIITIDGDDSKDFDDAVIVKQLENGNYKLGVSIADVSHYVTKDSILDDEAYRRGTSIYLPGRVIPMLPVNLSNNICSLVPGEDRLTITCDMEIDKSGKVVNYEIYPSVINSFRRMTYSKINKIFDGDVDLAEEYVELVGMFYDMRNLAKVLRKKRQTYGSINFETDEAYITLDENGRAVDIKLRDRGISEKLIEEFMLKANQVVAEHVFWLNLPFIYRVHDKPKEEKIERLLRMSAALGFKVKGKKEITNLELQKLLDNVKGSPAEKGINLLMLRSMQKAIYSENNIGHYGLAFTHYTHFTSPIRRYPDLIVHRLLREYLFMDNQSLDVINYYTDEMPDIATSTSKSERQAVLLEREVVDMKKAEYISKYINKEFDGIISSVTGFGIYVTLPNTVEGLVHITELDDDYYVYDENLMMLIGERKKKMYRIGDKVTVRVMKAHISEGDVDFKIV
ncbi:MAG: Ribonuclease R [Candidatus Izimaplasma bacterium HR2]|nr:MAG: Ribonuclease R [Candidatus Izimaplasma bacterium HR2]